MTPRSWLIPRYRGGLGALHGSVTESAWKTKPSRYFVATDDNMIPPDAQRAMSKHAGSTDVEAKGSHPLTRCSRGRWGLIAKAANVVAATCAYRKVDLRTAHSISKSATRVPVLAVRATML